MDENFKNQYQELLYQYLLEIDEHQLFHAQQFSKKFIENNISPEEALLFHLHSMKKKYDLPLVWEESLNSFWNLWYSMILLIKKEKLDESFFLKKR
jgi:hypothetical protein